MAATDDLAMLTDGFDVVHARIVRDFPKLVAELGGDPDALMVRAGVQRGGGMTYRQLIALMELAATTLKCPDFGMRLAKLQGGEGIFGPLGHVMKNSRTFGDALEYVRQHTYAHSLAARVWQRRDPSGGEIFSGHDILIDGDEVVHDSKRIREYLEWRYGDGEG